MDDFVSKALNSSTAASDKWRILREINREISLSFDQRPIMKLVAAKLRDLVPYDIFAFVLLTNVKRLLVRTSVPLHPEEVNKFYKLLLREFELISGPGVLGKEEELEFDTTGVVEETGETQVVSQVAYPILTRDEILGMFALGSTEKRRFSPEELQLLGIVATDVAMAVRNIVLYDNVKRVNADLERQAHDSQLKLEALYDITKTVFEPKLLFPKIVEKIVDVGRVKSCALKLSDRSGNLKVASKSEHSRGPHVGAAMTLTPGSLFTVPVKVKNKMYGVLELGQKLDGKDFDSADIDLLSTLAFYAGIAIQNTRLLKDALETRRTERELELSREIQEKLLPRVYPEIAGLDIAAGTRPARVIGGDFYNFFLLDEYRMGCVISDISGKGIPAALLMNMIRSVFKTVVETTEGVAEIMNTVNRLVTDDIDSYSFATCVYLIFDAKEQRIILSNAGHHPVLLFRETEEECRELNVEGVPIGIFDEYQYNRLEEACRPGDIFIIFTDGILDARSREELDFGLARLQNNVKKNKDKDAQGILNSIFSEVDSFAAGTNQFDDMTVVVLKVGDLP